MSEKDLPHKGITRREFVKSSLLASMALGAPTALGSCSSHLDLPPPGSIVRPEAGRALVLKNAALIDVRNGLRLPGSSVLVEGPRITAVSPEVGMEIPAGAVEVDLGGRTLLPGFINAHCHITMSGSIALKWGYFRDFGIQIETNCLEAVRHGVTTVRDMSGLPARIEELKERIGQGKLIGPRIISSGRSIRKTGGYPQMHGVMARMAKKVFQSIDGAQEAAEAVGIAVDNGAGFIKLFHQRRSLYMDRSIHDAPTLAEIEAAQNEAARRGLVAAMHITELEGFRKALDAGLPSFEHIPRDGMLEDEDIRRFVDGGHTLIPTSNVAWALSFPSRDDPNLNDPLVQEMIRDRGSRVAALLSEFCVPSHARCGLLLHDRLSDPFIYEEEKARTFLPVPDPTFFTAASAVGSRNLMRLREAGGRFGIGNDGGVPFIFPGAVGLEMMLLARLGFDRAELMRMATVNNAELLGLADDLGAVEPGKLADLVIVDGDPLESMENLFNVEAVFKEGALVHTAGAVTI